MIHLAEMTVAFQPSLFGAEDVSFDASFAGVRRLALDDRSWIEYAPGWVRGSDVLFDRWPFRLLRVVDCCSREASQ